MAQIEDQPAGDTVDALLESVIEFAIPSMITTINLGEIWYSLANRYSVDEAEQRVKEIRESGLQIIDVDWDLIHQAAYYKSQHKISYADGFAAALAKRLDAELVTGDQEFKSLESEIQIHWV